ncbi:MAG TPA: hypothetical protein VF230_12895 [Acidimicrobiales bacterium]
MAEPIDATKGWCCDGRTWAEHAHADGECCQPEGTHLHDLPDDARAKAEERIRSSGGDA